MIGPPKKFKDEKCTKMLDDPNVAKHSELTSQQLGNEATQWPWYSVKKEKRPQFEHGHEVITI